MYNFMSMLAADTTLTDEITKVIEDAVEKSAGKEWIVSLVAVIISALTIVATYFMNRETLKASSSNILKERKLDFLVNICKEITDYCDQLLILTSYAHMEAHMNNIIAYKNTHKDMSADDDKIINGLLADCQKIKSIDFNLRADIRVMALDGVFDADNRRLYSGKAEVRGANETDSHCSFDNRIVQAEIKGYADAAIKVYDLVQEYYTLDNARQSDFNKVIRALEDFRVQTDGITETMYNMIIAIQERLFIQKNNNDKRSSAV